MNIKTRLEKLEQRALEKAESTSNLVELVIPWPDEDGGPIRWRVTPEFIEKIEKIYGHHKGRDRAVL